MAGKTNEYHIYQNKEVVFAGLTIIFCKQLKNVFHTEIEGRKMLFVD